MISIIAAVDRNLGIGFQNKLLFWLPNDLKRFKALTTGNTIIMGRKTFESLPKGALPNRRNVVLSSNPATQCPGAEVFPTLEAALQSCQPERTSIYYRRIPFHTRSIPLADILFLTEFHSVFPFQYPFPLIRFWVNSFPFTFDFQSSSYRNRVPLHSIPILFHSEVPIPYSIPEILMRPDPLHSIQLASIPPVSRLIPFHSIPIHAIPLVSVSILFRSHFS